MKAFVISLIIWEKQNLENCINFIFYYFSFIILKSFYVVLSFRGGVEGMNGSSLKNIILKNESITHSSIKIYKQKIFKIIGTR